MAYRNLISVDCASKAEFFCRIRDFICARNGTYDYSTTGIGWTLLDSSYVVDENNPEAEDWFVIFSPGENGKEGFYFQLVWETSYFHIYGFQAWNPTTHSGANQYNTSSRSFNVPDTGIDVWNLWVYGDLSFIFLLDKQSSTVTHGTLFGKVSPFYKHQKGEIVTCSSALSSGSGVSITLPSIPDSWVVGRALFIRTTHIDPLSTVGIEKTIIKTLVGNTITCDLANNYTANSKLSDYNGYFTSYSTYATSSKSFLIGNSGSINKLGTLDDDVTVSTGNIDPDELENSYGLVGYNFSSDDGAYGVGDPYFWHGGAVGLLKEDVLTNFEGDMVRYHNIYGNSIFFIKEV